MGDMEETLLGRLDDAGGLFRWRSDARGRVVDLSASFERTSGVPAGDLIGSRFFRTSQSRFSSSDDAVIETAFASEAALGPVRLLVTGPGRITVFALSGVPAGPTGGYIGVGIRAAAAASMSDLAGGEDLVGRSEHDRWDAALDLDLSRRFMAQAQKLAGIAYSFTDLRTGAVFVSDLFIELIGLERDRVSIDGIRSRMHPEDARCYFALRADAIRDGRSFTAEVRFRSADGGWVYFRMSAEPRLDETGRPIGLFAVYQDIGEERRAKEELLQAQARMVEAEKIARIGHWWSDVKTGRAGWSDMMVELHGFDPRDADGVTRAGVARDRMHPDDRAWFEVMRNEAIAAGQPYEGDVRIGRPDGSWYWARMSGTPRFDEDGTFAGTFGTEQDITETKELEIRLKESQRNLQRALQLNRMGYVEWTAEEGMLRLSKEAAELRGLGGETRVPLGELFAQVHPDDRGGLMEARSDAVARGEPYDREVRVVLPDGSLRYNRLVFEPRIDRSGRLVGAFGIIQDITDRKRLELKLQESEGKLRYAQQIGRIGHWEYDGASGLVTLSEEARRLYDMTDGADFSPAELTARVHPDDRADFVEARDAALAGRRGYQHEHRLLLRDGRITHIRMLSQPTFDETGRHLRSFGIVQDITEQRAAEEARRRAEVLMTNVFENADIGILVKDLEGRYVRVNTRAAIQAGRRVDQILGRLAEEVIAERERSADIERLRQTDEQILATLGSVTYDTMHRGFDGRERKYRVHKFPVADADGNITGICIMRYDITEIAAAEEALKRLNEDLERTVAQRTEALRRTETRFRNIASAAADWLWELDEELRFVWCSENFFKETGRTEREMIGRPIGASFEADDGSWAAMAALLTSRQPIRGLEILRSHPTGERIVRISATPVWDGGVFIGYHGSSTDVTALKRAQAQLMESERLASLGGLVAGISHEISTPVGASYTVVTKLAQDFEQVKAAYAAGKLTQQAFDRFLDAIGEGVAVIQRCMERTTELIAHFKQVAVDQTSHKRRLFDLAELADGIVATLRPGWAKRPIVVVNDIPAGLTLDAFPGPLGQVLMNLIQNAALHGFDQRPDGGGRITLAAASEGPGSVRISVADDGRGMPPDVVRKVFEPFFTTRFGKGGSGLGMHLVYSIVNGVLGGRVEVESEPGGGTVVHVTVPVVAPSKDGAIP